MIYKIVQGNSFKLHILVRKVDVSKDFKRLVDFDMTTAKDVKVELLGCFCNSVSVDIKIRGVNRNVIECGIPGTLDIGVYDIKVSWNYKGYRMASVERRLLQIVPYNCKAKMPIGVVEGDTAGMFDLRYYVVTENVSICPVTYILDNISLSETPPLLKNGSSLTTVLTAAHGFSIGRVKVIMNGNDITHDVYKNGIISIPASSGYITIVASGDASQCYYGASAAKDMGELSMDELTKADGDLVGKTISVETTSDKPYVWFVSHVPLVFAQAGFTASLNSATLGGMYFYWTDELVAGIGNEYTISLK